jgi:hypothetical protein
LVQQQLALVPLQLWRAPELARPLDDL